MIQHVADERDAISRSAEQRMRQWALSLEVQQRLDRDKAKRHVVEKVRPYIAVSRQAGSAGTEVAEIVARRLGWEVLDRKLLDCIAEKLEVPHERLQAVDETRVHWFQEVFGHWLDRQVVSQSRYVRLLGQAVLLAAQHASVVVVGRGAQFLLPREKGLAVRVIAPRKQRIERIMHVHSFTYEQAKRYVDETDRNRDDFIRQYFHRDVADPSLYDLVLNMEHLPPLEAAQLIINQFERRFGAA
jgi:cytidylate kinase